MVCNLKWKKTHILYLFGFIACVLLGVFFLFSKESQEKDLQMLDFSSEESELVTKEIVVEETMVIKVDVKGEVIRPGLYIAKDGDRVQDVIEQAGSFTKQADRNSVNLAQRVQDQMVIYVPAIGEVVSDVRTPILQGQGGSMNQGDKININQASAEELQSITGIGPSKANAILQYREENGAFKSIDELMNISGIGDKTFEKLKDEITI